MVRALRYALRIFYLSLAALVIIAAVLVQCGRNFAYLATDYRELIAQWLSYEAHAQVKLEALNVRWQGLQPELNVTGIRIKNLAGANILRMDKARLRLDLLDSLLQWQPVWSNVAFSGGAMSMHQREKGQWVLQGVEGNTQAIDNKQNHQSLLNILLAAKRIAFDKTHLSFYFHSGDKVRLDSPSVLLENRDNFHRLQVRLNVASHKKALLFIAEGTGQPGQDDFRGSAYLQLQDFPTHKPAAAIVALLTGKTKALAAEHLNGSVDARLWFNGQGEDQGYDIVGNLRLKNLNLPVSGNLNVKSFTADVAGHASAGGPWQVSLQKAKLAVNNSHFDHISMRLASTELKGRPGLQGQLSQLSLQSLHKLLLSPQLLNPKSRWYDLVKTLNMRGSVNHIMVKAPLDDFTDWQLAAKLTDVGVDAWHHVPAFTQVSGTVHANKRGGYIDVDANAGFSMSFPRVYSHPLAFTRARGRVAWSLWPDKNRVYINSSTLSLSDGKELAEGSFLLSLPWHPHTRDSHLTLFLAARDMAAKQYQKYLPRKTPQSLQHWLNRAVGSNNPGVATRGAFIFRGDLNDKRHVAHELALALTIANGYLKYHDDWPAARNINGQLQLDNSKFSAQISSAEIYNSAVYDTAITLKDNPSDSGKILGVKGKLDGIASDGLRILRQSVLRRIVGHSTDDWFIHGSLKAGVDLKIPLQKDARGAYQDVQLDVDSANFALDNFNLNIKKFAGHIGYNSKSGLSSKHLGGQLFSHPVAITLATDHRASGDHTLVDARAQASMQQLAHWSSHPEFLLGHGLVPLKVHIEINNKSGRQPTSLLASKPVKSDDQLAAISVRANLGKVALKLPQPLAKAPGDPGVLNINYILGRKTALADVRYDDKLHALLKIDPVKKSLLSGAVSFAGKPQLPTEPALHVSGTLAQFAPDAWQQLWQRYQKLKTQLMANGSGGLASQPLQIPITANLLLNNQPLGPLNVHNLRVRARQSSKSWNFTFSSPMLSGKLKWPNDSHLAAELSLSSVTLPPKLLQNNTQKSHSPQLVVDTDHWRSTRVSINNLALGEKPLGHWQFLLQSTPAGLRLSNIHGAIRGLKVTGVKPNQGATLLWHTQGENPYTKISALLQADNMAEVLKNWQAPQALESQSAKYRVALHWPGGPQKVSLTNISGTVGVDITAGRFIRNSDSPGEGLLRLLGIFNFDSWARRLRLDFSDLYKSGLAFDTVTGKVQFDAGTLAITTPIKMQSPSSKMQLTGSVDLVHETLDTHLLATLPVANNLTVIAALAAGLPAAAGVWVVSKLFAKQVDKMTSVSYTITGRWDDPVTAFDRMFESSEQADKPAQEKTSHPGASTHSSTGSAAADKTSNKNL